MPKILTPQDPKKASMFVGNPLLLNLEQQPSHEHLFHPFSQNHQRSHCFISIRTPIPIHPYRNTLQNKTSIFQSATQIFIVICKPETLEFDPSGSGYPGVIPPFEVMAEASAALEAESVKHRLRRACPPVESGDVGDGEIFQSIAHENGWLEVGRQSFPFGKVYFQGLC